MIELVRRVIIDWRKDTIFPPSIVVEIEEYPNLKNFRFDYYNDLCIAEYKGLVVAYILNKDNTSSDKVTIPMKDGSLQTFNIDDICDDVHINSYQHDIKCKSVFLVVNKQKYSGFITIDILKALLEHYHPYVKIVNRSPIKLYDNRDVVYNIAICDNICTNPYHDGKFKTYKCPLCQTFDW